MTIMAKVKARSLIITELWAVMVLVYEYSDLAVNL